MSDDDYGDEGFDDYDDEGFDDFEDEPVESKESKKEAAPAAPVQQVDTSKLFAGASGGKISSYELSRRRQRAQDLRGLVSLSAESSELLSLSKLSPYDYYLRLVKNGALRQASQQTKADSRGVKIQTDHVRVDTKQCQVPDDLGFSANAGAGKSVQANAMALVRFLKRAYPVCETVLDANAPVSDADLGSGGRKTDFSVSSLGVALPASLGARTAVAMSSSGRSLSEFLVAYNRPSWAQGPMLAAGFEVDGKQDGGGEGKQSDGDDTQCVVQESGLLCLWDVARDKTLPDKVLVCEGEISCCAISPDRGELVVAATREGSIFVWDLREDAELHKSPEAHAAGILSGFRTPSYTTDATSDGTHAANLLQVDILSSGGQSAGGGQSSSALSLQIASLDSSGTVNIWTVIEVSTVDEAGPAADLGMGLGSSIKLILTASIQTAGPTEENDDIMALTAALANGNQLSLRQSTRQVGPAAYDAAFLPTDPSLFVVGVRHGAVVRRSRFGANPSPARYAPTRSDPSVRVTSIAFSPFQPSLFLVGLSTGDLALYHVDHAEAAMEWSALDSHQAGDCGRAVIKVCWSQVRACVFFVLTGDPTRTEGTGRSADKDVHSSLQIWDLSENVEEPVVRTTVATDSGAPIGGMATSQYTKRFEGRYPYVALFDDSGDVQVHVLNKEFAFSRGDEAAALNAFYESCPNPAVPKVPPLREKKSAPKSSAQEDRSAPVEEKDADEDVDSPRAEEKAADSDSGGEED